MSHAPKTAPPFIWTNKEQAWGKFLIPSRFKVHQTNTNQSSSTKTCSSRTSGDYAAANNVNLFCFDVDFFNFLLKTTCFENWLKLEKLELRGAAESEFTRAAKSTWSGEKQLFYRFRKSRIWIVRKTDSSSVSFRDRDCAETTFLFRATQKLLQSARPTRTRDPMAPPADSFLAN